MNDQIFMKEALALSKAAVAHGNEPFGAVLVKDGEIVFSNENQIHTRHDPTFHGEAGLIREFCSQTGITDLRAYTLYTSCEPCFMCSGAMYGPNSVVWSTAPAVKNWKAFLARKVVALPKSYLSALAGNPRFSAVFSARSASRS